MTSAPRPPVVSLDRSGELIVVVAADDRADLGEYGPFGGIACRRNHRRATNPRHLHSGDFNASSGAEDKQCALRGKHREL